MNEEEEDLNPQTPLPNPNFDLFHEVYDHPQPEEPSTRPPQEISNRSISSIYGPQQGPPTLFDMGEGGLNVYSED